MIIAMVDETGVSVWVLEVRWGVVNMCTWVTTEVIWWEVDDDLKAVGDVVALTIGERVSVSRKCADINATVPDMMGVSKAILENGRASHAHTHARQRGCPSQQRCDPPVDVTRFVRLTPSLDAGIGPSRASDSLL